jgi:hypothetical protein
MGKVTYAQLAQLADGVTTIAVELPRQAWRGRYLVNYLPLSAYKEDKLTKALPFIAGGIALFVAYNMFMRKK